MTTIDIHSPFQRSEAPEQGAAPGGAWVGLETFLGLAGVFVVSCLVGAYVVFRVCYPEVQRSGLRYPAWQWGAAQIGAMALAWACIELLGRHMDQGRRSAAMVLAAAAATLGVVALGLKGMEWGQSGGPRIVHVDPWPKAGPGPGAAPPAQREVKADPKQGAITFAASCAACHGAGGEGMAPIAPSLKDSEFMARSTDAQVAALVSNGRAANDPASKTGKAMPARGGNPFMSDAEIAGIVAFLRQLSGGKAGAAAPAAAGPAVPRWVVPLPSAAPAGLSPHLTQPAQPAWIPPDLQAQLPTAQEKAFAPVAAVFGILQTLHLLVGIAVAVALLWAAYAGGPGGGAPLVRFARLHWTVTLVLWLGLFPLLYVI